MTTSALEQVYEQLQSLGADRERRRAEVVAQFANADEATEFLLAALRSVQRSIPNGLAPKRFRRALELTAAAICIAQLGLPSTSAVARARVPVTESRNATGTWRQMRVALDALREVLNAAASLAEESGPDVRRAFRRAATRLWEAHCCAIDKAEAEAAAERKRDHKRPRVNTLIIAARRPKQRRSVPN